MEITYVVLGVPTKQMVCITIPKDSSALKIKIHIGEKVAYRMLEVQSLVLTFTIIPKNIFHSINCAVQQNQLEPPNSR